MATFEPVTDPGILAQLNAPAAPTATPPTPPSWEAVTAPNILAQLNAPDAPDNDPYSTAEGGVPVTPTQLTGLGSGLVHGAIAQPLESRW